VVTSAGSGISRILVVALAAEGAGVAVSDVDTVAVQETARQAKAAGADVLCASLDVTDRDAVSDCADTVTAHFGTVSQLDNNAGVEQPRPVRAL
jgi:NAD(P)-dependent dehydrogenase (short-subunit alcohol dehydrogenase family)